ncbi:MAG: zinc ribbon domain-containing protein [Gemmatimonadota bacterium]
MILEVVAAIIVGAFALGVVLEPLLRGSSQGVDLGGDAVDPEDTPRGMALAALKEIEFDRVTGKLSDNDYQSLTTEYTAKALEATRAEEREAVRVSLEEPAGAGTPEAVEALIDAKVLAIRAGSAGASSLPGCPVHGPRPEADAIFCSACGVRLPTGAVCAGCRAPVSPDSHFCEVCGRRVAA